MNTNRTTHAELRAAVREFAANSNLSDPAEIADAMLLGVTAATRKAWLAEALPVVVSHVLSSQRNTVLNQAFRSPRRMPSKSAKVAGVRDWWSQLMDQRIAIGAEWKPLGDCTADNLVQIVALRRERAAQVNSQADKYDTLLGLLSTYRVATVRELPADAVQSAGIEGLAA
ncbi:hypothetical protein [Williamsia phyllosphaerae]|uniref:Uncharacterized protein n=1 Tax=Williamsia phyllosphaerae TaxID=885042 RepID=A0ABQ1V4N7_9NOCA|nr:hypothetical protein [Williamsia phyllosphaerae]GGF38791.1 hypothetical protein GCM10007298_38120 [Williamsia phyllosphaerae]